MCKFSEALVVWLFYISYIFQHLSTQKEPEKRILQINNNTFCISPLLLSAYPYLHPEFKHGGHEVPVGSRKHFDIANAENTKEAMHALKIPYANSCQP
jgi:hypothetical protein